MARLRNPFQRRSRTELLPAFMPDGTPSTEDQQERVKEERPSQQRRLSSCFRPREPSQPTDTAGTSFFDEPSMINSSPRSTASRGETSSMEDEFDKHGWPSEHNIAPHFLRLRTSSQPDVMPRSLSDKVQPTQPPAVIPRTLSDKESSRLNGGPRSAPFPEGDPSMWTYPKSHEQLPMKGRDHYERPSERSITPQTFRPRTSSQPKAPPRKLFDREPSRLPSIPSPERKPVPANHYERYNRPAARGWRPQYAVFPPRAASPRAMPLRSPPQQARSATPTQQRSRSRPDHDRSATPAQHRSRSRPGEDRSATPTQYRSRSRPNQDRTARPTQYRSRSRPDQDRSATSTQQTPRSRVDQERPASPSAKHFDQLTEVLHRARFADLKDPPTTPLPPVSGAPLRMGQLAEFERQNLDKPRPLFSESMHSRFSKNRIQEGNNQQPDRQCDQRFDQQDDQQLDEQPDEQLDEHVDEHLEQDLHEQLDKQLDEQLRQQATFFQPESGNERPLPTLDLPSTSTSYSSSTSACSSAPTEPSSLKDSESEKTRPDSIMMAAAAAGALPPMFFEMQRHSYIPNGGRFHLDLTHTAELAGVMEGEEEDEEEDEDEAEDEAKVEAEPEAGPETEVAVQLVAHAPKDSLSSLSQYTDTWSEADMEEQVQSPITPIPDYDGLMRDLLVDLQTLKPEDTVSRVPRWAEAVLDWRTASHDDE